LFCFYSFFQIKEIEISGNQKVSTEDIRNSVEANIPKKILLFNSRSIFLVNLEKIEKELLGSFSQINMVIFDRNFPRKLIISIEERKPVAIAEKGGDDFFLDDKGIIFEEVFERSSWLVIKDQDFNQVELGERMIEEEKLTLILEIKSELKESGIRINLAEVINHQRVNVKTLEGWEIYFNLEDDIAQQVFNLITVLKEKIPSEKRGNLEYIDLRFGNQIYYK
jgi:cell division septal protein FtsQ